MTFDPQAYLPQLKKWFSSSITYKGQGTVKFLKPEGIIEGRTTARFDRYGKMTIEMTIEKFASEGLDDLSNPFKFAHFFSGVEHNKLAHSQTLSQLINNKCASLTISTTQGTFHAVTKGMRYSYGQTTIKFQPLQSYFIANKVAPSRYFVLPLYNFLADFDWYSPLLAQHPLRIYRSPDIPENLPYQQSLIAQINASSRRLIIFELDKQPAFIERLPDYNKAEKQLETGKHKCIITSILVGDVGDKEITHENWPEFKVNDYLSLLSLATGRHVAAPWLEIRDKHGHLLRRLHMNLSQPIFDQGIQAIGLGHMHGGIGQLLTQAQSSPEFGKLYVRATISQIVLGGYVNVERNIEDRMSHLFRALDAICEALALKKGQPITQYLSKTSADKAQQLIAAAVKEIKELDLKHLADKKAQEQEEEERKLLVRRINEAQTRPTGFAKALVRLLDHFGFPDAGICDQYFAAYPGFRKEKNWASVISAHRGKSIHEAWYDWQNAPPDLSEIMALNYHIRDLLVRIILKTLCYTGEYNPSIWNLRGLSKPIDWVKENTPAAQLGYGAQPQ